MAEEKQEEKQEQTPVDYQEQLKQSEYYKLASGYGVDLSGFAPDSEDALKEALDKIKEATKEKMFDGATQNKTTMELIPNEQGLQKAKEGLSEEEQKKLDEAFKELSKEKNEEITQQQTSERQNLNVENADEPSQEDENQDLEWIEKKRQAWKEFAASTSKELEEHDPQEPAKYSVGLKEVKGRVDYASANNASITKDADFLMYKGLVHDAAKNDLNLKLGDSLTGAQKLMFYAAVLSSTETYPNGEKLSLIGAPQIDPNSPDYQTLPDDVKKILSEELKRQQQERQGQEQGQEQQAPKPNEAETEKEKMAAMAKSLGIKDLPENPEEALKQIDEGIKKAAEFAGVKLENLDTVEKREAALKGISDQIMSDLSEITGKPKEDLNSEMPIPNLIRNFEAHKTIEARNLAALANDVGYKFDADGKGTPLTQLKNMPLADYKKLREEIAKKAVETKGWDQKRDAVYGASLANAFNNARGGR